MAKRFTDTDKWKDEWYTELSNDYKVIWQYLLDTCDNAGIYKRNIKLLNYYCNTNVSAEDILEVLKDRVSLISDDKWIINKFCVFQYGNDFLQSKNKAVVSAINKLIENKLYNNTTNSVLIPYPYSIDTPKEQEQDKVKDKNKENIKNKATYISKEKIKELIEELHNADNPSDIENILDDLKGIGWDYIYSVLEATDDMKNKLKLLVSNKLIILESK